MVLADGHVVAVEVVVALVAALSSSLLCLGVSSPDSIAAPPLWSLRLVCFAFHASVALLPKFCLFCLCCTTGGDRNSKQMAQKKAKRKR